MQRFSRFAGLTMVAAAVVAAPRSRAVGCDSDSDYVPNEVMGFGLVRSMDAGSFTIGEVRFDFPTPESPRIFCYSHDDATPSDLGTTASTSAIG